MTPRFASGEGFQLSPEGTLRISHEELSEMVGTTRPRISLFMQRFHNLGLIETNRVFSLVLWKFVFSVSMPEKFLL